MACGVYAPPLVRMRQHAPGRSGSPQLVMEQRARQRPIVSMVMAHAPLHSHNPPIAMEVGVRALVRARLPIHESGHRQLPRQAMEQHARQQQIVSLAMVHVLHRRRRRQCNRLIVLEIGVPALARVRLQMRGSGHRRRLKLETERHVHKRPTVNTVMVHACHCQAAPFRVRSITTHPRIRTMELARFTGAPTRLAPILTAGPHQMTAPAWLRSPSLSRSRSLGCSCCRRLRMQMVVGRM
jgi:hypothetical protein